MIRSHNEVVAMAIKAARGAGIPFGHAEDFGPVVAYLAVTFPNDLDCLQSVLRTTYAPLVMTQNDDTVTINNAQAVIAGPVALDALRAGAAVVQLCDVDAPALAKAYFNRAGAFHCVDDGKALRITTVAKTETEYVVQAIDMPGAIWTMLSHFAAKTYVPASDASRLMGAGAGLTDND